MWDLSSLLSLSWGYRGFIKFVSRWWKLKVVGGALRPGMGDYLGKLGTGGPKGSG